MPRTIRRLLAHAHDRLIASRFHRQHIVLLEREVIGSCMSLLDVGCGDGSHIVRCAPRLQSAIGIDIFPPSLERARERNVYTETHLMDARHVSNHFSPGSFDCVTAFDLIEHLDKAEGDTVLRAMEEIARKKIIVFTPNGFLSQDTFDGNINQIHKSGWSASDMQKRGYKVYGVHGPKGLLCEKSEPRWRPTRLWITITVLMQPLFLHLPGFAFQIFCVKSR